MRTGFLSSVRLWEIPIWGRTRHAFEAPEVSSTQQDYQKLCWILFFQLSPSSGSSPSISAPPELSKALRGKLLTVNRIVSCSLEVQFIYFIAFTALWCFWKGLLYYFLFVHVRVLAYHILLRNRSPPPPISHLHNNSGLRKGSVRTKLYLLE